MMPFDELWDYGQPEETRQRFAPLLDSPQATADVDYRAQLLTQIARTYSLQGKFAEAHQRLDEVEPLLTDEMLVAKARYFLERGRAHNSAGEKAQARELFLQALEAAEQAAADYHIIDALHMMGIVEPPEKQLEWSLKGLAQAEKSADKKARGWLGALYNNIGWSYHEVGEYEQALAMFKKGLAFRQKQGEAEPLRIAKWAVGRVLRSLEQYEDAYRWQADLLDEYARVGRKSGYVYEELAECCGPLLMPCTGRAFAYLAYQELAQDDWLVNHEGERLARLKQMADRRC